MFKSSTALFLALTLLAPLSRAQDALQIQPNAPDRYIVQKGDTLWAISGKYLQQPWRWPEIWGLNKAQIRNPHLIYPGDAVVLDRSAMRLSLVPGSGKGELGKPGKLSPQVRGESLGNEAIPTIPAKVIDPFLSRPLVIQPGGLDHAPRIVATGEGRFTIGAGDVAYAEGVHGSLSELWDVYRQGPALIDPDTDRELGYEAVFLGTARLVHEGRPATMRIVSANQEIAEGDYLIAATPPKIFHYAPHAPQHDPRARVISVYDGRTDARSSYYPGLKENSTQALGSYVEGGPLSIVSINKGAADGVEPGHVLALHRGTVIPRDRSTGPFYMGGPRPTEVYLPEERYGLLMVFRSFDSVSYALVLQAERPVTATDLALKP